MTGSDPTSGKPSVERLVETIRERVEERRRAGEYPEGLEDQLDLHFHHIAVRAVRDRLERLRVALEEADARGRELRADRIATESQRPGAGLAHRAVARLVRRQVEGALTQVREYADALAEAHRALLLAYGDLVAQMEELRDRLGAGEDREPQ